MTPAATFLEDAGFDVNTVRKAKNGYVCYMAYLATSITKATRFAVRLERCLQNDYPMAESKVVTVDANYPSGTMSKRRHGVTVFVPTERETDV